MERTPRPWISQYRTSLQCPRCCARSMPPHYHGRRSLVLSPGYSTTWMSGLLFFFFFFLPFLLDPAAAGAGGRACISASPFPPPSSASSSSSSSISTPPCRPVGFVLVLVQTDSFSPRLSPLSSLLSLPPPPPLPLHKFVMLPVWSSSPHICRGMRQGPVCASGRRQACGRYGGRRGLCGRRRRIRLRPARGIDRMYICC